MGKKLVYEALGTELILIRLEENIMSEVRTTVSNPWEGATEEEL